MKTSTIILATLLSLQISSLFANSDGVPVKTNKEMNFDIVLVSAPSTPKEATFEEMAPTAEIIVLAPVTPAEATFEDEAENFCITCIAPVTPSEADFNDEMPVQETTMVSLAPVTPAETDFTELP